MEKQASEEAPPNSYVDPSSQKDEHYYRPLLLAAYYGDWDTAMRFFEKDPDAKTAILTPNSQTVLHIASMTANDHFVERLVRLLTPISLAMGDSPRSRTALHYAAMGERIRMIKVLVGKNFTLTQLPDKDGNTPLDLLSHSAPKNPEVLWFLANATNNDPPGQPFTSPSAAILISNLVDNGFQDVTLHLVKRYPNLLSIKTEDDETVVSILARDPSNFLSGSGLNAIERLICKWITLDLDTRLRCGTDSSVAGRIGDLFWGVAENFGLRKIRDAKLRHDCSCELVRRTCESISHWEISEVLKFFQEDDTIIEATNKGAVELIEICLQYYPELIWSTRDGTDVLSSSITYRQERVFRLFSSQTALHKRAFLYKLPKEGKEEEKEKRRYLLPEVAKLSPNFKSLSVSGSAFHLQSEVQWFKAVEEFVDSRDTTLLTKNKTPWVDFKVANEELRKNGEQWMKDTSNSCMLVAALIATVVFAGAFTVPGGNMEIGTPVLLGQKSFMTFAIANALALFSSVTAILMFLSILTSRYDPIDFLKSLPQKFIIGLTCLFLSLAFMLASFGTALSILMDDRFRWIVIPIVLLSSIPIVLFITLQLPLFWAMVKSTYRPKIFHGKRFWN
ncbi:hypothetical protein MLD38_015386 [Melastoma candidum]|uniref:Uncharacterized protein n=1 Tax=Melastoma candidum TaxID=119954 RepID=A0ACB9RPE1_9MYRT|nr:hypothetical protein MLD38_015386 [Melastoma candidum]